MQHTTRRTLPRARWLAYGLIALAAGMAANSAMGPLLMGTIEYRFSETLINQGIGLDAVALFAGVPVALWAAYLVLVGHPAGPVLAFVPATFAVYMTPQYVIGPEYLILPGNNERFFVFHVVLFVLAFTLALFAWSCVDRPTLRPASLQADRRRSWVMFGVAAFILGGRWLPSIIDLTAGNLTNPDFIENPTSYLLIGFLDLGVITSAAVATGIALRFGVPWARVAVYVVIGWFALVPAAVTAMAVTMVVNGDQAASTATTIGFAAAAVVFTVGAALLYRPLFTDDPSETAGSGLATAVARSANDARNDPPDISADRVIGVPAPQGGAPK